LKNPFFFPEVVPLRKLAASPPKEVQVTPGSRTGTQAHGPIGAHLYFATRRDYGRARGSLKAIALL
jgi:hypothetical protein